MKNYKTNAHFSAFSLLTQKISLFLYKNGYFELLFCSSLDAVVLLARVLKSSLPKR